MIPEEDWELLTGAKYGRRIEIDNVIAYVGAERFWNEFILSSFQELFDTADYNLSRKKVTYITLSNLNLLNRLAEKAGTVAAADEVEKIESEHADYDISTKGFIEDINAFEKESTKRIENKESENEDVRWLEEELASLNEEFSRRTGIPIPSQDVEDGKEEKDLDSKDEDAEEDDDANDNCYSDSEVNPDDEDRDDGVAATGDQQ